MSVLVTVRNKTQTETRIKQETGVAVLMEKRLKQLSLPTLLCTLSISSPIIFYHNSKAKKDQITGFDIHTY